MKPNPGPTVFWWGSELRLLDPDGRCRRRAAAEGAGAAERVAEAAAAEFGRGASPRLVYQPENLEINGFASLESDRTRLVDAARTLRRRGLAVRGAWTLVSILEAASERGGRPRIALAASATRSIVSCLSPAGDRWVRILEGPDFPDGAIASFRNALACFEDGSPAEGIAVVEEGPHAESLREAAACLGPAGASLDELVTRPGLGVPGDSGDLLAGSRFDRRRWVKFGAAALAAALLASAGAGLYAARERRERERRWLAAKREFQNQETARDQAERKTAAAAARERALVPPQRDDALLSDVAAELPTEARVRRLEISGLEFEIAGTWDGPPEAAAESLARFREFLGQASHPWRLAPGTPDPPGGFFLRGRLNDEAENRPPGAGRLPTLAEICRGFTSGAVFSPIWPGWSVAPGPSERLPGFIIRHYTLAQNGAPLSAWTGIVQTVRQLCHQPGVRIERLILEVAPENEAVFGRAELGVEIRLKN